MSKRTVNAQAIREAAKREGSLKNLSRKSHVSLSWFEKACAGQLTGEPRKLTRDAVCRATKFSMDYVFPFVDANEKQQAS